METADGRTGLSAAADIIIVTWNGRDDTLRAVEAASGQHRAGSGIIVVDNGSTDGTAGAIRERFPKVRILNLPENRGFTGGVAAGVASSEADYIVLLNNDALPEPGWLAASIAGLETADSDVAAVSGKIVDMAGQHVDFIGGLLTFDGHAFQRDFRKPLAGASVPATGSELLFACGGNMIARRRIFTDLGGFDEDYFAYLEDVDFGWRSWLSGFRILYNDEAVVKHRSSATSDRLGAYERGVLFERNALQTAIKNYDDDMLRQFAGPMFLTLLHRLHHYSTSRNSGAASLMRSPLGDDTHPRPPRRERSTLSRLRRKLGAKLAARSGATVIDDPLTMMQFRATEWFFRNSDKLMKKREDVQRRRRRTDAEIFARFPIHYVPTYDGDGELMSSALFRMLRPAVPSVDQNIEDVMRL
jgi:GT2 family glycosyltransferase